MGLVIPLTTHTNGDEAPVHWPTAKAAVIERLNIIEEYEKLGVKFPNKQRGGKDFCWVECHAFGREDNVASAAVHCDLGIYVDKGGEKKAKDFFKFVAESGKFRSWYEGFKTYADQVGYKPGRVVRGGYGSILETIHEYRDADGDRRYACYRYRLPDGSKKPSLARWDDGEWVREKGCMKGVEPLPYRLPDLLAGYTDQDYILWTEGEDDVDRAHDAGFCATTSHMGATNWRNTGAKFLHLLPVHDYVIVPDNDKEGRAYAAEVAGALKEHFGAEATVKVVPLPGVPYGGNVSDWLGVFGTAEELRALIEAAPAWEPGQATEAPATEAPEPLKPRGRLCTVADLRKVMSGAAWTWEFWIANAALTALVAEAGTGKTRWLFDLHRRAYHGLTWPDGTPMNLPPGGRVLWIAADSQHQEMCDIPLEFNIPDEAILLNTPEDDPYGGTGLQTVNDLADFERNIMEVKPYWAVVDTITNTGDFKSQTTDDAKRQYEPLQKIALRTQTPIICVTHTNAAGKAIGRRVQEKVRTVVMLSHPDKDQAHRRRLWVEKTKAIKPPHLGVTMGDSGNEYDTRPPEEPEPSGKPSFSMSGQKVAKKDAAVDRIVDCLGRGALRSSEVKADSIKQGFSPGTYLRAKEVAIEQGLVREYPSDGHDVMELALRLKVCP